MSHCDASDGSFGDAINHRIYLERKRLCHQLSNSAAALMDGVCDGRSNTSRRCSRLTTSTDDLRRHCLERELRCLRDVWIVVRDERAQLRRCQLAAAGELTHQAGERRANTDAALA